MLIWTQLKLGDLYFLFLNLQHFLKYNIPHIFVSIINVIIYICVYKYMKFILCISEISHLIELLLVFISTNNFSVD